MAIGSTVQKLISSAPPEAVQLFDALVPLERYTEYQRDYNWEILFPRTISGVAGIAISKYCKRVAFSNQNVSKVQDYSVDAKLQFVPDALRIEQVQLTFLSPFPDFVQDYFIRWRDAAISPTGNFAVQKDYKCGVFIYLYTQQGITSNIIQLVGAFPVKLPSYNLAYANEDILKYEVTLSVDNMITRPMDITGAVKTTLPRVIGSIGKQLF